MDTGDIMTQQTSQAFNFAQGNANAAMGAGLGFLDSIRNAIQDLSYTIGSLDTSWVTPPSVQELTPDYASVPDAGDITFPSITEPTVPDISPVNWTYVPQFPQNTATLTAAPPAIGTLTPPTMDFAWGESPYGSQLLTDLRAQLDGYVLSGGTGLGTAVETAIWENAQLRVQQEFEKQYEQAQNFWAARGFTLPPGALDALLSEAAVEQTRKLTYTANEIAIEQARIAKDQTQKVWDIATGLESHTLDYFSSVATRSLEASKFSLDAGIKIFQATVEYFVAQINIYKAQVEAFTSQVEAYKAEVSAETAKVEAYKAAAETALASNKQYLDIFAAEIDQYKALIQYQVSQVDSLTRIFTAKTGLYDAQIRMVLGSWNAQVEDFKGQIQEASIQANIMVEQAKLNLQAYLGKIDVAIKALAAGGEISAHMAAAALSSIHAQAGMSAVYEEINNVTSAAVTG